MPDLDDRYAHGGYAEHNDDWHEGRAGWKAEQVAGLLTKHGITPGSVCDIGCGTAGVLDELAGLITPRPSTLVGYELSPDAVAMVPPARRARVEVVNASHEADDRAFELLISLDVFEHVEDYYGFLRSIRSKAPLAVFHVPIDTAVTSVLRPAPMLRSAEKVGHIQHFTRAGALQALRHAGYEILDAYHTVPARDLSPTTPRGRLGKAARLTAARVNVDAAARWLTGFPLLVLART